MHERRDKLDVSSSPPGPRVCVVVSRYNGSVTSALRDGALEAYRGRHPLGPAPDVVEAPGAFELAVLASAAIESGRFDGVVALGCVVRGETEHDRHISGAVANALALLSVQSVVPVAFGVLTVNTPEQARARAGGAKGNKGQEAMEAVLDAIEAKRGLLGLDTDGGVPFQIGRSIQDKAAAEPVAAPGRGPDGRPG